MCAYIYRQLYIFRLGHASLIHASSCRPYIRKVRAMCKYLFIAPGVSQQSTVLQSSFHCVQYNSLCSKAPEGLEIECFCKYIYLAIYTSQSSVLLSLLSFVKFSSVSFSSSLMICLFLFILPIKMSNTEPSLSIGPLH